MSTTTPDYAAITRMQQQTWALGDFSEIARSVVPASESLCQAVDPHPRQRVLDVACGNGNTALVAARRYCDVTGLDFVPQLLERARARAQAQGLPLELVEGDAQNMPFANESFDCVVSSFGVMFAPDQARSASELVRVCKPGGKIGLACWTPQSAPAELFKTVTRYVPPPPGLDPPFRWGTEEGLRELIGSRARFMTSELKDVRMYFPSVSYAVDVFRKWFGPVKRAFDSLDSSGRNALARDLAQVFERNNQVTDGTLGMDGVYLQTVLIRV